MTDGQQITDSADTPPATNARDETRAMQYCYEQINVLDHKAQHRALNWITARLYDDHQEDPF